MSVSSRPARQPRRREKERWDTTDITDVVSSGRTWGLGGRKTKSNLGDQSATFPPIKCIQADYMSSAADTGINQH